MKQQKSFRLAAVISAAFLVMSLSLPVFETGNVSAAQITSRNMELQAGGGGDGGSLAGGSVNHELNFTLPTSGNVGSILFEYCTLASGTCTAPTGVDTTSASLGDQSGATGFTIDNTTNGAPYITRTAASITGPQAVTYRLDDVVNPTDVNVTFYVRISSYASEDTSGGSTDTGVVAASTAEPIDLTGTMPESLVFCTGETISTTGGVPDCTTATAGDITFSQLFSPVATSTASSQMAASTNAGSGYAITVNGATMTSGANTVSALGTADTSILGTSQFGLNLKDNATPDVGTEVAPAANGTNYRGQAVTGYNTADSYKFATGDIVADSANGGPGGTDAQIFTATYIVNVPGSQPAGTYTTTLTYICTPTF